MAILQQIVGFLDRELKVAEMEDYAGALNGLQLENGGHVGKIAAAVDASLTTIRRAVANQADLLIVHHGMFWQGAQAITGAWYEKLKTAIDGELAIYSAHLPLDAHPHWGNNALLAQALGVQIDGGFLDWKGVAIGVQGELEIEFGELVKLTETVVGGAVHYCTGGKNRVHRIGICTGAAGSEVAQAAKAGVDVLITGEGPHWSYVLAEELGIHVIYAGHYATETFGVKKLVQVLAEKFECGSLFIDHPSGL